LTVISTSASVRAPVPAPARPTIATPGRKSFQELAAELDPLLYACAMRLCRNPVEARDLVQDTFEHGLRDFDRLRPDSNVRGWLTTILYHRFMDRCRARTQEPPRADLEQVADEHPAEEARLEEAWERVTVEDVVQALDRLEEPFREVYRLAALERRPYKEISSVLNIPVATVGTRLLRARARLRALLLKEAEG
jgi:RNA polymerase sigma-70 factor (ECF subfamily)